MQYPFKKSVKPTTLPTPVLLSFGSNLGNRHETLNDAWRVLGQTPGIQTVRLSRFYETEPVGGPAGQPMYINAAGIIETILSPPLKLLETLQNIESDFGRVRTERWGARTLDIDILLYDDQVVELPALTIPHPEMLLRQFVLVPACDIAGDWVHPLTGMTVREHLHFSGRDTSHRHKVVVFVPSPWGESQD